MSIINDKAPVWSKKLAQSVNPTDAKLFSFRCARLGRVDDAIKWSESAFSLDSDPRVALTLASLYYREEDFDSALSWAKKAALGGDDEARYRMADILFQMAKGIEDVQEREALYVKATQTDPSLMSHLASLFYKDGDMDSALTWCRLAVSGGCPHAKDFLSRILVKKADETEEPKKKELLYREAAENGSADAAYSLSVIFEKQGNSSDARRFLSKAARAGHHRASEMVSAGPSRDERKAGSTRPDCHGQGSYTSGAGSWGSDVGVLRGGATMPVRRTCSRCEGTGLLDRAP